MNFEKKSSYFKKKEFSNVQLLNEIKYLKEIINLY